MKTGGIIQCHWDAARIVQSGGWGVGSHTVSKWGFSLVTPLLTADKLAICWSVYTVHDKSSSLSILLLRTTDQNHQQSKLLHTFIHFWVPVNGIMHAAWQLTHSVLSQEFFCCLVVILLESVQKALIFLQFADQRDCSQCT